MSSVGVNLFSVSKYEDNGDDIKYIKLFILGDSQESDFDFHAFKLNRRQAKELGLYLLNKVDGYLDSTTEVDLIEGE